MSKNKLLEDKKVNKITRYRTLSEKNKLIKKTELFLNLLKKQDDKLKINYS